MKYINLLLAPVLLLNLSCARKTENNADIKKLEYHTASGKVFIIVEDVSAGVDVSILTIRTHYFSEDNHDIELGRVDPVEDIFMSDLDEDGFQEIYLITRSTSPEEYATIVGFASDRDRRAVKVSFDRALTPGQAAGSPYAGYAGHDQFKLRDGFIVHSFQVSSEEKATGQTRSVRYTLSKEGDQWMLVSVDA